MTIHALRKFEPAITAIHRLQNCGSDRKLDVIVAVQARDIPPILFHMKYETWTVARSVQVGVAMLPQQVHQLRIKKYRKQTSDEPALCSSCTAVLGNNSFSKIQNVPIKLHRGASLQLLLNWKCTTCYIFWVPVVALFAQHAMHICHIVTWSLSGCKIRSIQYNYIHFPVYGTVTLPDGFRYKLPKHVVEF
jgi:hypothetical protein